MEPAPECWRPARVDNLFLLPADLPTRACGTSLIHPVDLPDDARGDRLAPVVADRLHSPGGIYAAMIAAPSHTLPVAATFVVRTRTPTNRGKCGRRRNMFDLCLLPTLGSFPTGGWPGGEYWPTASRSCDDLSEFRARDLRAGKAYLWLCHLRLSSPEMRTRQPQQLSGDRLLRRVASWRDADVAAVLDH